VFDLFFKKSSIEYPIKLYTKFEFIKRRYSDELERITDYYRNRIRAVDNKHPISRIVNTLAPDINMELIDYFKIVDTSSRFVSKQFGFVSNINKGKVFDSVFYGKNSKEVFLYTEYDIDLFEIEYTWQSEKAIKCVYTEDSSCDFYCPIGDKDFEKNRMSVYEIDLRLLLLQYKFWSRMQIDMDLGTNTNEFIANFVLPNMMEDLLDMNIYNRYNNILLGKGMNDNIYPHPFHVLDYRKGMDNIFKRIKKDNTNSKMFIEQIIGTCPLVSNNSFKLLQLNNRMFNRQSMWALMVSRVDYILGILKILGSKGISTNLTEITKLPITIKELENGEPAIKGVLGVELYKDFKRKINEISEIVGRR